MKSKQIKFSVLLILMILCLHLAGTAQSKNPLYDKALADSLGADEYGMKMYVLVILTSGAAKIEDKKTTDSLFAGHLKNIKRLADAGKLVVAGPMSNNDKNYRGIFILNLRTQAEAKELLKTDPAIKANLLGSELYGWYGSAALPVYLHASEKVAKINF